MPRWRAVTARDQRLESSRDIGVLPLVALVLQLIDRVHAVCIEHLKIGYCVVGVKSIRASPLIERGAQEGLKLLGFNVPVTPRALCSFFRRLLAISTSCWGLGLTVFAARRRRKGVGVLHGRHARRRLRSTLAFPAPAPPIADVSSFGATIICMPTSPWALAHALSAFATVGSFGVGGKDHSAPPISASLLRTQWRFEDAARNSRQLRWRALCIWQLGA
jgi:hypothetical protein